jgi:hypothetical protein
LISKGNFELRQNKAGPNFLHRADVAQTYPRIANSFCGQDCEQAGAERHKYLIRKGKIAAPKISACKANSPPVDFPTFFVDKIVSKRAGMGGAACF